MIILQNTLQQHKLQFIIIFFILQELSAPAIFFYFLIVLIVITVHITRLWTKTLCDLHFYHQNEENFAAVCIIYLFLRNFTWDTGT